MEIRKKFTVIIATMLIVHSFVGCSSKSGEDQIISVANGVAEELEDNGESNYIVVEAGKRMLTQMTATVIGAVEAKKCNLDVLEKGGKQLNNKKLDFDWSSAFVDVANKICEDGKISQSKKEAFQKGIMEEFESQYN